MMSESQPVEFIPSSQDIDAECQQRVTDGIVNDIMKGFLEVRAERRRKARD